MMLSMFTLWFFLESTPVFDQLAPVKQVGNLAPKQTLTSLLRHFEVKQSTIAEAVSRSKGVFDPRAMRTGQPWQAYLEKDGKTLRYFVYTENRRDSVIFDFKRPIKVYRHSRPVARTIRMAKGRIRDNLFTALAEHQQPRSLAPLMRDLFANDVAFDKLQKGDSFRIIYEAQTLDDRLFGRPDILAARLVHKGHTYYRFAIDGQILDEDGMASKPLFLKAPIKNGIVTSSYRKRRYHPILKRYTPHLGTDYGALKGTPILALADGTISEVAKNRYNGRYVKIRHDGVYETQYLHMSRWAKDLRTGQEIRQGDVIGYVGNSGLAYGYHVCLRLWKKGKQVDFKKQTFPQSKERPSANSLKTMGELKRSLDKDGV